MKKGSLRFEGVLDGYFEGYLEDNPTVAAVAGIRSGEGKLGRSGFVHERRESARRREALLALDEISPAELSGEQQLDRLAFRAHLVHAEEEEARGRSRLDPAALDHVLSILLRELQRGDDQPKRAAENIRSLVRECPQYLSGAARLIEKPERIWRGIMDQTWKASGSLISAVEEFLSSNGPESRDKGDLRSMVKAFGAYRATVMEKPLAPVNSFAIGAAAMQRRVREELGLDYTLAEVEALALSECARVSQLLKRECARFGKNRRPDEILSEARAQWDPGADLIGTYRRETERIAQGFREANAMTFPENESLEIRPVPEFMRHLFPTAAYSAPGPFERRQRGVFWVNDLSLTKKKEEEKNAERAQHFGLSLTCAHEAYPGHHLQFVRANQHGRKWRRMFAHAVFYEGWTLWCEQMVVDLKIERSPWAQVMQLHDALWRCHRILVDLRLQTGKYSYSAAVGHMQKHLGFTKARAQADVNWYTAQAATPMSYWLGRLENQRLRRKLMDGRGWTLQQFNDWLLSFGTLPQGWIEKYGLE